MGQRLAIAIALLCIFFTISECVDRSKFRRYALAHPNTVKKYRVEATLSFIVAHADSHVLALSSGVTRPPSADATGTLS